MNHFLDACIKILERSVRRVLKERTTDAKDRTLRMLKLLYGDPATSEYLWHAHQDGTMHPSQLLKDLEEIAASLSIPAAGGSAGSADLNEVIHRCFVTASVAHTRADAHAIRRNLKGLLQHIRNMWEHRGSFSNVLGCSGLRGYFGSMAFGF